MPNLFSSLTECLGFSHMIKSTSFKVEITLGLKSFKFPIGVAIMYRPFFKIFIVFLFLFTIYSCTPQTFSNEGISTDKENQQSEKEIYEVKKEKEEKIIEKKVALFENKKIINEIEIILPEFDNNLITKNFINALELSLYKKNTQKISFNINLYLNSKHLQKILSKKASPGKIFIGPLTSDDTNKINKWCSKGAIFFSFASDRKLASDCIYLINFFPEDEIETLFNFFGSGKRIALLYPENEYGFYISKIVDDIATQSNSLLINKASYKEDLSDARKAIKELSKYELRKYELNRQKKILSGKDDDISQKALKKIEKFETIGELDFTHILIPDYNIRLLQIAPLLPFYDVDPNKVQFVGTGVWDDEVFFYEPSLQGAIFPGVEKENRENFVNEYLKVYEEQPIRTITIIYDLVGLLNYIIENNLTINSTTNLLNNHDTTFEGIDGQFSFKDNLIKRELHVLKISNGIAKSVD